MRNTAYRTGSKQHIYVPQQMICAPLHSFSKMKALKQSKYVLFAIKLCELCSNGAGHSFSSGLWVMWPIIVRKMSLAHVYTSGRTDGSIHTILLSPHKSNMMGQIHLTLHFREHIIGNRIFPA